MTKRAEVRPEIQDYSSPDMRGIHPSAFVPEFYEDVYYLLEMPIGIAGQDAADVFSVMIATPEGLRRHAGEATIISDRGTLVVTDYRWKDIEARLEKIVAACTSQSWSECLAKLQRYFNWEYDNMR